MGMFLSDLQAVLHVLGNSDFDKDCVVTYGTQTIHGSLSDAIAFSIKNNLPLNDISDTELYNKSKKGLDANLEGNVLLKMLGFKEIINLDLLKKLIYL